MFSYIPWKNAVLLGLLKCSLTAGNWAVKKTEGRRVRESEKETN